MTDLVKRLRRVAANRLELEAADEIERLRTENKRLRDETEHKDTMDYNEALERRW